jgi:Ca2+-binding EF-hand superfamily protein
MDSSKSVSLYGGRRSHKRRSKRSKTTGRKSIRKSSRKIKSSKRMSGGKRKGSKTAGHKGGAKKRSRKMKGGSAGDITFNQMWREMDADKSGSVSPAEFVSYIKSKFGLTESQAQLLVKFVNADNSNTISSIELQRLDINKDGSTNANEIKSIVQQLTVPVSLIDSNINITFGQMWREMDSDKSGSVTINEFVSYMKSKFGLTESQAQKVAKHINVDNGPTISSLELQKLDVNKDNSTNLNEIKNMVQQLGGGKRKGSKTAGHKVGVKHSSKRRSSKRRSIKNSLKRKQKGGACVDAEIMSANSFGELLLVVEKHRTDIKACDRCNDSNIVGLLKGLRDVYQTQTPSGEAMRYVPDLKTPQGRNDFNAKNNKNGSNLICNKCSIRAKIYQLVNRHLKPEERLDFQL